MDKQTLAIQRHIETCRECGARSDRNATKTLAHMATLAGKEKKT